LPAVALLLACFALSAVSCVWPENGTSLSCECGAPPRCGTACTASCGCCPVGASECSSAGIILKNANLNCYDVIPCSGLDRCVVGSNGPVCAESKSDCETVRAAYEAWLRSLPMATVRSGSGLLDAGTYPDIQCPEACKVTEGNCAQGLDTCWFLSYGPDPERDRLANLYQALACPALGPCNCPPAPIASCQYDSSQSMGSFRGPLTCTVE